MKRILKYTIALLVFSAVIQSSPEKLFAPTPPAEEANAATTIYQPLVIKLASDGFSPEYLSKLFDPNTSEFYDRLAKVNLVHKEVKDPYERMFNSSAIRSCRHYLAQHQDTFDSVEQTYGVDKDVIVSILYVESRFGKGGGHHPVLYTFSSIFLANTEWNLKSLETELDSIYPDLTKIERLRKINWLQDRAEQKSAWAYNELKTLLQLDQKGVVDITNLKGSWAGAFGMPQFLPSSFNAFAVDGNGDGQIDLYNEEDAIFSTANYLHKNGWRPNSSTKNKRRVIWRYNHSTPYIDLILKLANAVDESS